MRQALQVVPGSPGSRFRQNAAILHLPILSTPRSQWRSHDIVRCLTSKKYLRNFEKSETAQPPGLFSVRGTAVHLFMMLNKPEEMISTSTKVSRKRAQVQCMIFPSKFSALNTILELENTRVNTEDDRNNKTLGLE